jgi:dTDP-4-dehydrorhamnose 3,5-epimerase
MKILKTKFKDLLIVKSKVFFDNRGFFRETFRKKILKKNLIFGCASKSKKNVLRGLHLQSKNAQGKFISVVKGEIFDVAVDLRKNSSTFGKYFNIKLSEKNGKSIFIPAGFAHGFVGLKKENIIYYFCTSYRSASHENGIKWNDKDLKIKWPIKKPIVSKKDKKNISFKDYINKFIK